MFGGKDPGKWVTQHASPGYGRDKLNKNAFTGWLGAVNSVKYANLISRRGVEKFVVDMHQSLINSKMKTVVANAVRNFNATNPTEMKKVA